MKGQALGVALVASVVVLTGCGSTYTPGRAVPADPDFTARLDTLARAYSASDAETVAAFYAPGVYSLSFNLPYKLDTGKPAHTATLAALFDAVQELRVEPVGVADVWRTDERVWTNRRVRGSVTLKSGVRIGLEGWHSAIWEPRGAAWVIVYEHLGGAVEHRDEPADAADATDATPSDTGQPGAEAEEEEPAEQAGEPEAEARLELPDVFFDFDRTEVRADQQGVVEQIAAWLRATPGIDVTIEGHCDARGSEAYNLELGRRRAEAVKAMLVRLGVAAERVRVASYGESRPADPSEGEQAWARNRRAHVDHD